MLDELQRALLQPLAILSARIRKEPLLTQAAGGNTSIKSDGVLWVKASGKWLARAEDEQIFVPVDLAGVRRRIAAARWIRSSLKPSRRRACKDCVLRLRRRCMR
jgi:rhamnose utilization protein RhaD (predicted bifunctional aldolase and dehydrogenase)